MVKSKFASKKPVVKAPKKGSDNNMKYVLIVVLSLLLVYALYYVYKVNKMNKETYENSGYDVMYFRYANCPYCQKFDPVFTEWKQKTNVNTNIYEKTDNIAQQYNITAYPTVIIAKDGAEVKRQVGYTDIGTLTKFVSSFTL